MMDENGRLMYAYINPPFAKLEKTVRRIVADQVEIMLLCPWTEGDPRGLEVL